MSAARPLERRGSAAHAIVLIALGLLFSACATKIGAIQDYVAGVEKFKQRDFEAAEKLWLGAFQTFHQNRSWSESADVAANLGGLFLNQHRYQEAIGFLNWSVRIRELAREPVPRAKALLDISAAERALWKTKDAIQHADEAYGIFESAGNKRGQAEARSQRAMAQYAAENLQAALESLEQALEFYRAVSDAPGEVLTLARLVFIRDARGEASSATALAEEAASKASGLNEPTVRATALMARGLTRRAAGKLDGAEADVREALQIFNQQNELVGQANALQELGTTYLLSGKADDALKSFREAGARFEKAKNRAGQARIPALIGNAYVYAGDYTAALRSYHEAHALKKNLEDQRGEAKILLNLGVVYDFIGDRAKATELYKQALEAYQKLDDKRGEAMALTKYGLALRDDRKLDEAKTVIEKALAIHRGLKDPLGESFGLVNLGTIFEELGQYRQAIDVYDQALPLKEQSNDRAGYARVLLNMGLSLNMLREYRAAQEKLRTAMSVAEGLRLPELLWQIHFALGAVAENTHDKNSAAQYYKNAISTIENVRGRLASGTFRADFFQGKVFVYEELIRLHLADANFASSLHYVERAKARAFLDMMGNKQVSAKGAVDKTFREKQVALESRIHSLSAALSHGSADQSILERSGAGAILKAAVTTESRAELAAQLQKAVRDYQELQEQIQRANPELGNLVTVNPLETSDIRALLDADSALIEYYVTREVVYGFVVTRSQVRGRRLDISAPALHEAVRRFRREVIEEPVKSAQLRGFFDTSYRTNLRELYDQLIAPFQSEIGRAKHLIIVPHGVLHYLPFQALWDGTRYVIHTHSVSYAPSASVLKFAKEKQKASRKTFLGVGNPDGSLPQAQAEVLEIAKSFLTQKVLTGAEATSDAVKQLMPSYDIVHLATHGVLDRRLPLLSHLRFSAKKSATSVVRPAQSPNGGPPGESRLTVNEIFDLNLQAALVVLSACETGLLGGYRGNESSLQGDELVGLARAFIYAGTPTVIASLWNVADLSTGELMVNFYRNLQGNQVSEALRVAQAQFLSGKVDLAKASAQRGVGGTVKATEETLLPGDHPYFWAPFVVIGDWR